jgi:pilus assembly protein Flp/PilA
MRFIAALLQDKTAATAIEYGLILALLALGIIGAVQGIGDQVSATFNSTSSTMANG